MNFFENPGRKLKVLTVIWFILLIIATCVVAFLIGASGSTFRGGFNFLTFFLILIGGFIFAYIISIFIYAFGNLVENVELLSSKISQDIKIDLKTIKTKMLEEVNMTASSQEERINQDISVPNRYGRNPYSKTTPSGTWICPACHKANLQTAIFCNNCGKSK